MNDVTKVPNHVAIIVDGNGRWAKEKGFSRSFGHKKGADNLKKISKYIFSKGIKILSVFIFSTENFNRPANEVNYLMDLFVKTFTSISKNYLKENIKVIFSGKRDGLNEKVIIAMNNLTEKTKNGTRGILNFCLNYGGQDEIVDATKKICHDVINNKLDINSINKDIFNSYLYNDLPAIDFMIRTSGESRISNFMLWQLSYAELYFCRDYFPDFNTKDFDLAIDIYNGRERRFGGVKNEDKNN